MENGATLRLLPGPHDLRILDVAAHARIEVMGAVEITAAAFVNLGERVFVGPAAGLALTVASVWLGS